MPRPALSDLKVGQPTRWAIQDRNGTLLLRKGAMVDNERQLQLLLARGVYHMTDDRGGGREPEPKAAAEPEAAPSAFAVTGVLAGELTDLHREIDRILDFHRPGVPGELNAIAGKVMALGKSDADAPLAALYYGSMDGGISERHLHAALLTLLLADALELDEAARRTLVCAAITYDLGLGARQLEMNQQRTPLTPDQLHEVRRHPLRGARLLEHAGVYDPDWLDAVAQHHERVDGSGYPSQVQGTAICIGARVLGLIDIYTAMIRPRAYRDAVHSRQALRTLFLERGKLVDERIATLLVKEVGVFSPGTLVRLKNGEIAAVHRRGKDAAHPLLMCLITRDGVPLSRASPRDPFDPSCAIVETVNFLDFRSVHGMLPTLWAK